MMWVLYIIAWFFMGCFCYAVLNQTIDKYSRYNRDTGLDEMGFLIFLSIGLWPIILVGCFGIRIGNYMHNVLKVGDE